MQDAWQPESTCRTQRKDLHQALEPAGELGVEMPATWLCRDPYDGLLERGDEDLAHSALVREISARSATG